MKRLIWLVAALSALGSTGIAASAKAAARAELRGQECTRALEPAQRLVSVTAVMRPLKGTKSMELQFNLLSRTATTPWAAVHGGDLGSWLSPPKQVPPLGTRSSDVWTLRHPVADLPAPATYRFRVVFRWLGAHKRVLGDEVRQTPVCYQPELRPDLVAVAFSAQTIPNRPKRNLYTATIKNAGLTGASNFEIEFTGNGFVAPNNVITVKHIGPHETLTRTFRGPVCDASAAPVMTIDPTQQIGVYTRANATLTATCPPAMAPPAG